MLYGPHSGRSGAVTDCMGGVGEPAPGVKWSTLTMRNQ